MSGSAQPPGGASTAQASGFIQDGGFDFAGHARLLTSDADLYDGD